MSINAPPFLDPCHTGMLVVGRKKGVWDSIINTGLITCPLPCVTRGRPVGQKLMSYAVCDSSCSGMMEPWRRDRHRAHSGRYSVPMSHSQETKGN